MEDQTQSRLASLEVKLEFLKELLTEIRNDLKEHPNRQEFEDLERRITVLEDDNKELKNNQTPLLIKVGIATGLISFIAAWLLKFFL